MDEQRIQFSEYKFDSVPYTVNLNVLEKKVQTKNYEDIGDSKKNRIDLFINEALQECSTVAEKIRAVHTENSHIQMELLTFKQEEEQLSNTDFDLKEGIT